MVYISITFKIVIKYDYYIVFITVCQYNIVLCYNLYIKKRKEIV